MNIKTEGRKDTAWNVKRRKVKGMIYIKRFPKHVIIGMGDGDVGSEAMMSPNPNIGMFILDNIKPGVIGSRVTLEKPKPVNKCKVVCYFHKTESIDVWIRTLTELKKLMNDLK